MSVRVNIKETKTNAPVGSVGFSLGNILVATDTLATAGVVEDTKKRSLF